MATHIMYLTIDGVRKKLVDVAKEKGMPVGLLRQRYHRGFTGNRLFAPTSKGYKGDGTYKWSLSGLRSRCISKSS